MAWTTIAYLGIGLIGLGGVLALREHSWLQNAQVTDGTVIELIASRGSKGSTYTPRIRYRALDGSEHEFKRGYSSSPPGFVKGERVTVAYDSRTYDARILTFGQRFGFAVIIASIGLAMALMAGTFILGRNLVPRIYDQRAVHGDVERDRIGF